MTSNHIMNGLSKWTILQDYRALTVAAINIETYFQIFFQYSSSSKFFTGNLSLHFLWKSLFDNTIALVELELEIPLMTIIL